jgi:hypothetical protein
MDFSSEEDYKNEMLLLRNKWIVEGRKAEGGSLRSIYRDGYLTEDELKKIYCRREREKGCQQPLRVRIPTVQETLDKTSTN